MDYVDWKAGYQAYIASVDVRKQDALRARLHNLETEERIDNEIGIFRNQLINEFSRRRVAGQSPADAADAALDDVISATWTAQHLLKKLAAPVRNGKVSTYATALDLAQYGGLGDIEADDPPERVDVPDGKVFAGSRKHLVWITPDDCSDDPDNIAKGLGLPHFINQIIFHFELECIGFSVYVPTCLDARLYEAWQKALPTESLTVGRTRHVETGSRPYQELVVANADSQGHWSSGTRLPRGAPAARVSPMTPNYMVGR